MNNMENTTRRAAGNAGAQRNSGIHGKKRRTKLSRPLAISNLVFAGLAAALIVVAIVFIFNNRPSVDLEELRDDGTFFDGIRINGVDVSGMGYSAARAAVLSSVKQDLESINITVAHGTRLWILTAADMGVSSTLDATLTEAISLGRSGSVIENNEIKSELAAGGRDFSVTFVPDEATLRAKLASIGAAVDTAPTEPSASALTTGSSPDFVYNEGADGYVLDESALYENIATLLSSGNYVTTLEPELDYASPTQSIDDIKAVTEFVSSFETSFGGSRAARNEKRVGNIQKACTLLNGLSVANGEEFNFNAYFGPRTEAGGWPLAPGIVNGNQYEDQAGGGICQVSTTFYNALLCANASLQRGSTLEEVLSANIEGISITERRHHSWPSSYVDTGLDSTVTGTVESGKSLNFVNNTGYPLYVFAYCDTANYTVTIYIYGKPLPEGVTYQVRGVVDEVLTATTNTVYDTAQPADYKEETIKARDGYKATAYRDKYVNGVLDSTETLYEDTYNPVTGEIVIGTGGAPAPAATPAG